MASPPALALFIAANARFPPICTLCFCASARVSHSPSNFISALSTRFFSASNAVSAVWAALAWVLSGNCVMNPCNAPIIPAYCAGWNDAFPG